MRGSAGTREAGEEGVISRLERSDWIWGLAGACAATLVALVLSSAVFGRIPHVQDSIAQLFQARIFAGGGLWAPAPPAPEIFDYTQVVLANGRWYSQYPPGHSLLLMPGVLLGVPWLVNPLLGGLALLGIFLLGLELFGPRVARLALLLGLVSPFLLLMSAEFMSHAGSLFALTYFLLFHFRATRTRAVRDAVLAGAFLALAVLIRPYSAFAMALPAGVHALVTLRRKGRDLLKPLALVAAGGAAGVALLLLYNWGTTGGAFRFGYTALAGPGVGLGFGKGPGAQTHTLARGLGFTWERIAGLNGRLFEWPLTSLWPLGVAFIAGGRTTRRGRLWLMLGFPVALLAAYAVYWYQDANDCFGPRYVYEALGPLLLLSAAGILTTGEWIAHRLSGKRGGIAAGGPKDAAKAHAARGLNGWSVAIAILVLFTLAGGASRWPRLFRSPQAGAMMTGRDEALARARSPFDHYGRDYWGVSPDLGEAVGRIPGKAIVFVDTRTSSEVDALRGRIARQLVFGSAFAHEEPYLERARVVFAHLTPPRWTAPPGDAGDALLHLVAAHVQRFPGRTPYVYQPGRMTAPEEIHLE